jgi:hypothetical protein
MCCTYVYKCYICLRVHHTSFLHFLNYNEMPVICTSTYCVETYLVLDTPKRNTSLLTDMLVILCSPMVLTYVMYVTPPPQLQGQDPCRAMMPRHDACLPASYHTLITDDCSALYIYAVNIYLQALWLSSRPSTTGLLPGLSSSGTHSLFILCVHIHYSSGVYTFIIHPHSKEFYSL